MNFTHPFFPRCQSHFKNASDIGNFKILTNPLGAAIDAGKLMMHKPGDALTMMAGVGKGGTPSVVTGYGKATLNPAAGYAYKRPGDGQASQNNILAGVKPSGPNPWDAQMAAQAQGASANGVNTILQSSGSKITGTGPAALS